MGLIINVYGVWGYLILLRALLWTVRKTLCSLLHATGSWKLFDSAMERSVTKTVSDLECVWNVMAHSQKPDFVFRRKGRVHLNRWGRQFSRLLTAEVSASAVVMVDTPRFEVVWE